jgi:hypothetical protein
MLNKYFSKNRLRYRVSEIVYRNDYKYYLIINTVTKGKILVTGKTLRKYLDEYKNANRRRWENVVI